MSESLDHSAESKKDFYHRQFLAAYDGEAMGHGEGGVEPLTPNEKAECDALLSAAGFVAMDKKERDSALAYVRGSFLLGLRQLGSGTLSPEDKRLLKAELLEDLADMRDRAGDDQSRSYRAAA